MEAMQLPAWDRERLGELAEVLHEHGKNLSMGVIRDISSIVHTCLPVSKVVTFLYQRKVVSYDDFEDLGKDPPSAGIKLSRALVNSSKRNVGEGKDLIKNLYLALLDAFLDTHDRGCHYLALHLRQTAIEHLKCKGLFSEENGTDIKSAIMRIPDVELQSPTASQLRRKLDLPSRGVEITNLKSILMEYQDKVAFGPKPDDWLVPLVKAMMLTQGVGRYVTKLLPFHKSYPVELLIFLDSLGEKWEDYALFLGFTNDEIYGLKRRSFGKTQQEIKNFSKVWRIPDMERANDDILHCVLEEANIDLGCKGAHKETPVADSSPAISSKLELRLRLDDGGKTITAQLSHQGSAESPRLPSQRGSLDRRSTASHPLRSMQSGSSDLGRSIESDTPYPLNGRNSQAIEGDTDNMSEISSLPYVRHSSLLEGEDDSTFPSMDPVSTKPTTQHHPSIPALQNTCGTQDFDSTPPCPTTIREETCGDNPDLPKIRPDDEVTLQPNDLGTGVYGTVWGVEHKGSCYVAKEYRSGLIGSRELQEIFTQEMLSLKHKNVVRYLGVCHIKDTERSVVVMEKFSKNLESICRRNKEEKTELQPETKLSVLSQVADGLAYLHSQGIIHCDLIPTNILLLTEPEYTAKIADCGNSLVKPISDVRLEGRPEEAVARDYLSPEALEGEIIPEIDVFSFGHLTVYVILQREPHPLKNPTYRLKGKRIARTEVERREDFFDEVGTKVQGSVLEPLMEWAKKCLSNEASERPAMAQFTVQPQKR